MISPDLIAKVMSVPLGIFSGDLKECPTLVCFVLQNTNYVSLMRAYNKSGTHVRFLYGRADVRKVILIQILSPLVLLELQCNSLDKTPSEALLNAKQTLAYGHMDNTDNPNFELARDPGSSRYPVSEIRKDMAVEKIRSLPTLYQDILRFVKMSTQNRNEGYNTVSSSPVSVLSTADVSNTKGYNKSVNNAMH
ncbi:hypothetical protein llap_7727 [Limosa lapponica baueri]|uniref:Uncharacterized protein n=1 Tax=Limosa lapponica baueri TaxID=1758121 RepID=A0A2I0U7E8_LIMLA|nr:hypothetical protein llap_7727 [Limosa lapponica baueri]